MIVRLRGWILRLEIRAADVREDMDGERAWRRSLWGKTESIGTLWKSWLYVSCDLSFEAKLQTKLISNISGA